MIKRISDDMFEPSPSVELTPLCALGCVRGIYINTPAQAIRKYFDSLFPSLAKNVHADIISGGGHRFKTGHDLLVDVIGSNQSIMDKVRHAGHILLTDFPTKAGIPFPGFSQSGLGQLLIDLGIPKGYLSLNICDAGIGVIAIGEGSSDLMQAVSGNLTLNDAWSVYDTLGEGTIEITTGVFTENPLLLLSGTENITAGAVSIAKDIGNWFDGHIFTMPEFLGGGLTGFAIGSVLTALSSKGKSKKQIAQNLSSMSGRTMLLGGLSTLSAGFSIGAAVGMFGIAFGKYLAKLRASSCTEKEFMASVKWNMEDPLFVDIWKSTNMKPLISDADVKNMIYDNSALENFIPKDITLSQVGIL